MSKAYFKWTKHWLTDRSQKADVNGPLPANGGAQIGVLRRSVLGPKLFNIFINDLRANRKLLHGIGEKTFCTMVCVIYQRKAAQSLMAGM